MRDLNVETNLKICTMSIRNSPAKKIIDVIAVNKSFEVTIICVQILSFIHYLTSLDLDYFIRDHYNASHIVVLRFS